MEKNMEIMDIEFSYPRYAQKIDKVRVVLIYEDGNRDIHLVDKNIISEIASLIKSKI